MRRRPFWSEVRQQVSESLWIAPLAASLLAIGLVAGLNSVDRAIPQDLERWYLFGGQPDSARELLSTIAGSLMTLAGVLFSITVLVLQLASSQFSPRVLRTFLNNRFTQVAIGVFVGSFVYTLALLLEIRDDPSAGSPFVPALSIFVAFLLALVSVGVFVRYIHHMAHSIRAVHIMAQVARDARDSMATVFPEPYVDAVEDRTTPPSFAGDPACHVEARRAGMVAEVSERMLQHLAESRDLVIEMVPSMGDFVPRGGTLFRVWGPDAVADGDLLDCVLLADERTPDQDPAFGFRQLVDIAERALSPGINDPTTAVQALDQIHDLLRALCCRRFPSAVHVDRHGRPRVIIPRPDWASYVHLGLDEIRQYGRGSLQVVTRIRAVLLDLLSVAPPARRPPLERQLRLLDLAIRKGFDVDAELDLARRADSQGA